MKWEGLMLQRRHEICSRQEFCCLYSLTLRSGSAQELKFSVSGLRCFDEQLTAHGKRAELVFQAQTLQLEGRTDGHEHVIALRSQRHPFQGVTARRKPLTEIPKWRRAQKFASSARSICAYSYQICSDCVVYTCSVSLRGLANTPAGKSPARRFPAPRAGCSPAAGFATSRRRRGGAGRFAGCRGHADGWASWWR